MAHRICKVVASLLVFITCSAAQSPGIDTKLATQYFRQLKQTSDRDGGKTWGPTLYGPIMFVDPRSGNIVANQADLEHKLVPQDGVFVGTLPRELSPANTAMSWAGVHWTMVMWPVSELRQGRERLLLHECFHRLQEKLGLPARDAVNAHLDTLNGRIWIQMEWRALERALRETGPARKAAIADALLFRVYRRSLFPDSANNESALELNEGLAEYTGVKLSSAGVPETVVRANLILRQGRNNPTFARSFAYVSGPAYGALLDLSGRPWRSVVKPTTDLGALLQQRYGITIHASETAARAALSRYEGEEIVAIETQQDQRRKQQIVEARKKFLDGPVLVLSLSPDVNYSYDPNNVIGIDAGNTVYPTMRLVDAWGVLTVSNGAWLERDATGRLVRARVQAPVDLSARPLKGEGWSLELANGWEVVPGERRGDVMLKSGEPVSSFPRITSRESEQVRKGGLPPLLMHHDFKD
ncbi:MAG TPA: hypothetical protein VKB02_10910 [Pyrinomonadaceae bacterium]|nr:hypothetical protein [Pyrinomonadaceae bacterium]